MASVTPWYAPWDNPRGATTVPHGSCHGSSHPVGRAMRYTMVYTMGDAMENPMWNDSFIHSHVMRYGEPRGV